MVKKQESKTTGKGHGGARPGSGPKKGFPTDTISITGAVTVLEEVRSASKKIINAEAERIKVMPKEEAEKLGKEALKEWKKIKAARKKK